MRLLLALAVALLPVGVLSSWAGAGLLRERKVLRRGGLPAPAAERLGSAAVCALCLAVGVLATAGAVATLVLAVSAFG